MFKKICLYFCLFFSILMAQEIDINNPLVQKYLEQNQVVVPSHQDKKETLPKNLSDKSNQKSISNYENFLSSQQRYSSEKEKYLSQKEKEKLLKYEEQAQKEPVMTEKEKAMLEEYKYLSDKQKYLMEKQSHKPKEDLSQYSLKSDVYNIDEAEVLLQINEDELLLKKIKEEVLLKQKEKNGHLILEGKSPFLYQNEEKILETMENKKIKLSEEELVRFGNSFFEETSAEPLAFITPPDDYLLSIGDTMKVSIYGLENNNYELEIDKEGNINIPKFGMLQLIGLNYFQARELLMEKLENLYPKANIFVSLGNLRTISITVAGEAKQPGQYNLPALSKVKDALIYASGVSDVGSMRNIKIVRNQKTIAKFDLYSLLREGKSDGDIILRSGDIVFIPVAKNLITINGNVRTPAIYELQKNETLKELISFAGGIKSDSVKTAKIQRSLSGKRDFLEVSLKQSIPLIDGDIVQIGQIADFAKNKVTLLGNVYRSEDFEIQTNQTAGGLLRQIVNLYGLENVFMPQTDMNYFVIQRLNTKTLQKETHAKNLLNVLDEANDEDIVLQSGDELYFFNKNLTQSVKYVTVEGEVLREGNFNYYKGMKLIDALSSAGIKKESDVQKIRVVSMNDNFQKEVKFYSYEDSFNVLLNQYDEIKISNYFETNEFPTITVSGAVNENGVFPYTEKLTLKDAIDYAKGIKSSARVDFFELVSFQTVNNVRVASVQRLNFQEAIKNNINLQPYDEIIIQEIKGWSERNVITLKGEVLFPGEYTIMPGEKLSSVIKRAGGFTEQAFVKGSIFSREDVKRIQQEALQRQIKELENSILFYATRGKEAGTDSASQSVLLNYMENIKAQAKDIEVVGRVALKIEKDLETFAKSEYDVVLKNGDQLSVPTHEDSVMVLGEVMSQTALAWAEDDDVSDYIEKVGGLKESADINGIFIIKASGEAQKVGNSKIFGLSSIDIEKGDVIVVPFNVSQFSGIQYAKDITGILYQLAVSAAALQTVGAL